MLRIDQRIPMRDIKFIITNIMQKHIDPAEIIRRNVDLLSIKALTDVFPAKILGHFEKERSGPITKF